MTSLQCTDLFQIFQYPDALIVPSNSVCALIGQAHLSIAPIQHWVSIIGRDTNVFFARPAAGNWPTRHVTSSQVTSMVVHCLTHRSLNEIRDNSRRCLKMYFRVFFLLKYHFCIFIFVVVVVVVMLCYYHCYNRCFLLFIVIDIDIIRIISIIISSSSVLFI